MSSRKESIGLRLAFFFAFLYLFFTIPCNAQNPNWDLPNSSEFSNSAYVVASIYINDTLSNNSGDQIAFFVDDEIRGLSTAVPIGGSDYLYFVTIFSNLVTEEMVVKVYSATSDIVYEVTGTFFFEAGSIIGSIDSPFQFNVYNDNDDPIYINPVPSQLTLEGIPFAEIDMFSYLVQSDSDEIIWSYTANPDLEVDILDGVLIVNGAIGFTGTTTLTVRATKIPSNSFVETDINYIVTPFYEGPAWNTIPPQSILLGDQFIPVNLHDYEYQYEGAAIQYDYIPILIPNINPTPAPIWTVNSNYEVNMILVIEINYTPKYQLSHEDDVLAAFIDQEVRGVTTVDSESGLFYLSIEGSPTESGTINLKFYSGEKQEEYILDISYLFQPYQIIGSVDNPIMVDLAPIVPDFPDSLVLDGIAIVPLNIVDSTFVGIEHFKFMAYDPDYPDILYADTTTSFCIAADSTYLTTLYADTDLDGLGDPYVSIQSCDGVLNFVANDADCDDSNYLECVSDTILFNDFGECAAIVPALLEPLFNDCHVTSISNNAPDTIPLGTMAIKWNVEFNETATKSCVQMVTVLDNEAPVPEVGGVNLIWDEIYITSASNAPMNQQFGNDVDISHEWAVVGARYDNELGNEAGAAYILKFEAGTWIQHSKLLATNGQMNDEFGASVSISDNRILIGAPGNDDTVQDGGTAYIFEYNGTNWIETEILVPNNPSIDDRFGSSVSVDKNYAAIGTISEDSIALNSGAVYIFEYSNNWTESAVLKASDAESDDHFGCDLSVSGSQIVIGAKEEDSDGLNAGAVYIFERNDFGIWNQSEKLTINNPEAGRELGTSVDISGNHVAIGAPKSDLNGLDYGVVLVYSKIGNNWFEEQVLQPDSLHTFAGFGASVSISSNYLIAGAPYLNASSPTEGEAYIFRNDGTIWSLQSSLEASDFEIEDYFGSSVSAFGHNVLIGAPGKDNLLADQGKSYLFKLNASLPFDDSACNLESVAPTALDNCGGIVTGVIDEISSYIGLSIIEVKWSYTDSSGNTSFQYQMIQPSEDTIPPTITCLEEVSLFLDNNGNLVVDIPDSLYVTNDNCGILSVGFLPSTLNCTHIGTTTIDVTVADGVGNQASCQIDAIVQEGPKIVTNLSNSEPGSLRMLIEGSCGGTESVIYFDPALIGTINLLSNPILIDKDLEIVGLGKDIIDISSNNSMRIFEISPSSSVILRSLQLSNGVEPIDGGAILNYGNLSLDNIRFVGNSENGYLKALTNSGILRVIGGIVEVKE